MKSKPMKLTTTSYAVLAVLDQIGEATSYDLKQSIEKSIQNFWPVPHTTAYEEPARLADAGYLSVNQEKGGRRRKTYAMTDRGRDALRAWAGDPGVAAPQLRDGMVLKVFAGGDPAGMVGERTAWHQAKLEELSGLLADVRGVEGYKRSESTLLAGLSYHQRMLQMLEDLS
jgi:PadR family transcriptional regulator, regulatory protein AphA